MHLRIALCLLASVTSPVRAESPIAEVVCAPRAEIVQRMTRRYGAAPAATGLRDIDTLLEVWTAPSGDWTLVQTYADGLSCILAMGAAWDMPRDPGRGAG